jgi:ribosomal protein L11 methyltransferase
MPAEEGWISVEVTLPEDTDEAQLDVLSGALFEAGAAGIETKNSPEMIRQALANDLPVTPGPVVVVASFSPELSGEDLPKLVGEILDATGLEALKLDVRTEAPVDWATHWRAHFKPLSFGKLWIVPTWLEPPKEAQVVLRMDPGMAFGTGSHETTALCLEKIAELSPIPSLLDVGTGTGVLALAALKLGAARTVGTDNDPDALVVAKENAVLNGLGDRLVLSGRDPADLGERFAVVVANILAAPLVKLAPQITRAVIPGGELVLSGVLGTQAEDVARAYEERGFARRQIASRGEWARIDLRAPFVSEPGP